MTRKKVKLALISNESARKATFKKRKKGLMKKVSELSTLCGIESCAIVYSPYEAAPDVWPDARGAQRVVAQFQRMPEMEQSKKMVNQESFLRHRIAKAADLLTKLHRDNRHNHLTHLMYHCLTGNCKPLAALLLPDLNDIACLLDHNLNDISKRIHALKKAAPPPPPPEEELLPAVVVDRKEELLDAAGGNVQRPPPQQQQQWFAEWNPSDQQQQQQFGNGGGGSGGGYDHQMVVPFNDGNNHAAAMWSNMFFP